MVEKTEQLNAENLSKSCHQFQLTRKKFCLKNHFFKIYFRSSKALCDENESDLICLESLLEMNVSMKNEEVFSYRFIYRFNVNFKRFA